MKKLITLTVLAVMLFGLAPTAANAQLEIDVSDDFDSVIFDAVYFDPNAEEDNTAGCFSGSNVEILPNSVPEPWRGLLTEAAAKYEADVGILAVVLYVENRGFPDPDKNWSVSGGGARGPFQFRDSTWDAYGVDGNGDGKKDVNDITDASYGAANYIKSLGGVTGLSMGSLEQDFSKENADKDTVAWVLKSYNAGPSTFRNSDGVWYRPTGTWGNAKQNEINTYIEMGLDKYQELAGTEGGINPGGGCGGLGITEDLVFPLVTTQEDIRKGVDGGIWCYESLTNCHGAGNPDEYNAADIHAPVGTPVVAAVGGTVIMVNNSDQSLSIRIHGDDGLYYFYQHMTIGSQQVVKGDSVRDGALLGEVGDRVAAFGTAPHLHFDVASERVGISRECVKNGQCDREKSLMIDAQPKLVEAFKQLPED